MVVVLLFLVTTFTGFPGPGSLRRYSYASLRDLADRANAEMDYIYGCGGAPMARVNHPVASVDLLRSRVWVPTTFAVGPTSSRIRPAEFEMFENGTVFRSVIVDCG